MINTFCCASNGCVFAAKFLPSCVWLECVFNDVFHTMHPRAETICGRLLTETGRCSTAPTTVYPSVGSHSVGHYAYIRIQLQLPHPSVASPSKPLTWCVIIRPVTIPCYACGTFPMSALHPSCTLPTPRATTCMVVMRRDLPLAHAIPNYWSMI